MNRRHAGRRRRSPFTVAALVAVVVAGGAVAAKAESWLPLTRPFEISGTIGQPADVGPVQLEVHGARAGHALNDGLSEVRTNGVWVAVDISVTPIDEPAGIEELVLRDGRGREFRHASRVENPMIETDFDPGVSSRGDVIFEVPEGALGDVELVISPDDAGRDIPRAMVTMPLDVDRPDEKPLEPRLPELAESGADE